VAVEEEEDLLETKQVYMFGKPNLGARVTDYLESIPRASYWQKLQP
jgi:hypothetical protein